MKTLFLSISLVVICCSCTKADPPIETSEPTLTHGLILHYPFNGNANDFSGNNYHVKFNTASFSKDRYGVSNKAYYFNGYSSYMTLPLMPEAADLDTFTLSFWINPKSVNGQQELLNIKPYPDSIYSGNMTHSIKLFKGDEAGKYSMRSALTSCQFSPYSTSCYDMPWPEVPVQKTNQWHHFLLMKKGNELVTYVDGELATERSLNIGPVSLSHGGTIGVFSGQGAGYYNGDLDDLRVYNRALTEAEVKQVYTDQL